MAIRYIFLQITLVPLPTLNLQVISNFWLTIISPLLYGWDELPNDFNKDNFKDFPEDLFKKITQLRKGLGMKILYTTQDLSLIDIAFRRLTFYVNQCNTFKGRLTYIYKYRIDYYMQLKSSNSVDNKAKIPMSAVSIYVQNERLRSTFDSFMEI